MNTTHRFLFVSASMLFALVPFVACNAQTSPAPAPTTPVTPPAAAIQPAQTPRPASTTSPKDATTTQPDAAAASSADEPLASGNGQPPLASGNGSQAPLAAGAADPTVCADFSCIDANRDSKLSADELTNSGPASMQLEMLDMDRNGAIDEIEYERFYQDNPGLKRGR